MISSELDQVNVWMDHQAAGLSSDQLLNLFSQAVAALWQNANLTMSNFILSSIMERVLQESLEGFPLLALLKIDEEGVHFNELQSRVKSLNEGDLIGGFRFLLGEFL